MLNFRKLKQDFSPNILKDGKTLNEKEATKAVKIVKLAVDLIRLHCEVEGSFDKTYKCEIEIDRRESNRYRFPMFLPIQIHLLTFISCTFLLRR